MLRQPTHVLDRRGCAPDDASPSVTSSREWHDVPPLPVRPQPGDRLAARPAAATTLERGEGADPTTASGSLPPALVAPLLLGYGSARRPVGGLQRRLELRRARVEAAQVGHALAVRGRKASLAVPAHALGECLTRAVVPLPARPRPSQPRPRTMRAQARNQGRPTGPRRGGICGSGCRALAARRGGRGEARLRARRQLTPTSWAERSFARRIRRRHATEGALALPKRRRHQTESRSPTDRRGTNGASSLSRVRQWPLTP